LRPWFSKLPTFLLLLTRSLWASKGRVVLQGTIFALLTIPLLSGLWFDRVAAPPSRRGDFGLAGRSALRLLPPASDMDEEVLEELAWSRSMGEMLPVVEGWAAPVKDPGRVVRVLGVDLLRDRAARELSFEGRDGKTMGDEAFRAAWVQSESFFVAEGHARERGWTVGDSVPFDVNGRTVTLVLAGTLPDPLWMEGAGEKVALLDIAAAQVFLGMEGRISRVEWVTPGAASTARLREALQKTRPVGTRLEATEALLAVGPGKIRAPWWVGSLALLMLMGVFLLGFLRSLHARTEDERLALLRAGAGETTVRMLWGARVVVGAALGVGLAWFLKGPLLRFLGLSAARGPWDLPALGIIALAFLVVIALVARERDLPRAVREAEGFPFKALGVAVALLAVCVSSLLVTRWGPSLSFLLGCAAFYPLGLVAWSIAFAALEPIARVVPSILPRLALLDLRGKRRFVAPALAVAAMGGALFLSPLLAARAHRDALRDWSQQAMRADLSVKAHASLPMGETFLPSGFLSSLRGLEGVAAVRSVRVLRAHSFGQAFDLCACDMMWAASWGGWVFPRGVEAKATLSRLSGRLAGVVSESLANRLRLSAGSTVEIETPSGRVPLEVVGVYVDPTDREGTLWVDRGTLRSLFRDDRVNGAAVFLTRGASAVSARKAIEALAEASGHLAVSSDVERREALLRTPVWVHAALGIVAALLLILGLASVALALLGSKREAEDGDELLRRLGASTRRRRSIVLLESALLGVGGALLGLAAGVGGGYLLTRVWMPQALGGSLPFGVPWMVWGIAGGVYAVSCLGVGWVVSRRRIP